jgi:hypothetical protein
MSKTMKNKAASMALFATMMAMGALPLAAQAPDSYFLEAANAAGTSVTKNSDRDMNASEVVVRGSSYSKADSED